jgi:hypothetical protein
MFEEGDLIFRYTRAQAIADGVLADLMQAETAPLVKEAGFKFPIAMTATAFWEAVAPIDGELPPGQDLKGRLWDVLMLLKAAIRSKPGEPDRIHFTVNVWNGEKSVPVQLWALCGPGDDLEPVVTIMLEGED